MAVDPYSPCPCGSGQKFKWCCQKVEAHAERADRLAQNGQLDSAIEVLEEGLKKEKDNAWLLTRKAIYQLRQHKADAAKTTLERVLAKQPKHLGALALFTRLVLEIDGPEAGAAQYQKALSAAPEERGLMGNLARLVGVSLSEAGHFAAALKHLELGRTLSPEGAPGFEVIAYIRRNPVISPWLKNPYRLSTPPGNLAGTARERFEDALHRAESGLWASAASGFELLCADKVAGTDAERNLGLCRLWMADDAGAVKALRRYIARVGPTTDAVDLEALCQLIAPPGPDDVVEHVQLIWPLRDGDGLLKILRDDPLVHPLGEGPIDSEDPESPEVEQFGLLDRKPIEFRADLRVDEVPRFQARVLVGKEIVALETYDDGRLDGQIERFRSLAGSTISPAHPRTKVLGKVTRTALALSWDWLVPENDDQEVVERMNRQEGARLVRENWPNTPAPFLGGKTPLRAAEAGGFEVPLRASVLLLEATHEEWGKDLDFNALRTSLRIASEPPVDAEKTDLAQLHLARLDRLEVDGLSDERLVEVYRRGAAYGLFGVLERAARALLDRPGCWEAARISSMQIHADLASLAAAEGRGQEALDWIRRGREAEPDTKRAANAYSWDLLELKLRARVEHPEKWVPELAVMLERFTEDSAANEALLTTMIQMGLIAMMPHPEKPGEYLMDPRVLQSLLAQYGPRVTTASGQLGVAATRGQLWTPGSSAAGGGSGGIWTPGAPGSPAQGAADKPKLIIPGR